VLPSALHLDRHQRVQDADEGRSGRRGSAGRSSPRRSGRRPGATLPDGAINTSNNRPFSPGAPPPNYAVNLPAAIGTGSGGGIAFGILKDNLRLDLTLTALESSGKAKVISSPKVVTVDPQPVLNTPRLWWPVNCGEQYLYNLTLAFEAGAEIAEESDEHQRYEAVDEDHAELAAPVKAAKKTISRLLPTFSLSC
jgi:hypothetical protein